MNSWSKRGQRRQQGGALLEALVAMVLLGVLGLGMTYALGRTMVASKHHRAQSLAVQSIRADLQRAGLANGCAPAGQSVQARSLQVGAARNLGNASKTCTVQQVQVAIGAAPPRSVTVAQVRYDFEAETLLGPGTLVLEN